MNITVKWPDDNQRSKLFWIFYTKLMVFGHILGRENWNIWIWTR